MQTDTDRIRARLQAQRQQEGTEPCRGTRAAPVQPVPTCARTALPDDWFERLGRHVERDVARMRERGELPPDPTKSGPRTQPIDPNNPPVGIVTIQSPNGRDLYEVTIHRKPKSQVELFASRAAESMARGDRGKAAYWSQQCARLLGRKTV